MQHDNIKLHAILSKLHIEHTQNGATVQHTHMKQVIATICPKQQLGILPSVFEHVLVISGDSSVFMFCCALPVHHVHAFCFHVELL